MKHFALDPNDERAIKTAIDVIERNYHEGRHDVGAAVLCASGNIYAGVNIESCGYGPCAEPIAIGAAISHGEREFLTVVAVEGWNPTHAPMPPCGNCRQLMIDYMPEAMVILHVEGKLVKVKAKDLLPHPYYNFDPPVE
jgi:cytidine deaminase